MRNHLKIIMLLLISFTIVIALAGCTRPVSDTRQEEKPDTTALDTQKTAQKSTPLRYFFINGSLLGSHDEDGWHSLCDTGDSEAGATDAMTFYAKDLLNQDSYYVYENNQQVGESKQIIWLTGEAFGLGSFESEDAPEMFAEYGRLYHFEGDSSTAYRIFDLPLKLGPELSKLKIPDYSFRTDFVFGEKWERRSSGYKFVTNSGADLFPRKLPYDIEPTAEGNQYLLDLFKENDMENTVPNWTDCVGGDFDNDGNEEYLMLAENPTSELGYPLLCGNGKTDHLGIFNIALYQDDEGSIQNLYSDLRPYNGIFQANKDNNMELMGPKYCIGIDFLTAADLDSDGIYEIGVIIKEWESGFYLAFALDDRDKYKVVMRSNFGM